MLQEILLSLSGHHSPLWDQVKDDLSNDRHDSIRNYLAPSEKALLAPLAHLSLLHIKLRDHIAEVSTSHPSLVCRTVASSIASETLEKFRRKILEVEKSILMKDAAYVGAYGIVPLSTVVGEFMPWTRRLEWLWQVATYMMLPANDDQQRKAKCTGAQIINYLEKETYTGYSDLEDMATSLLESAQRTWMRQVATWVLYGKLPTYGAEDFCIEETGSKTTADGEAYALRHSLVPKCMSQITAVSLLSIGESLNQIRAQNTASLRASKDPVMALLPSTLAHLNTLTYPLSSAILASTISSIRLSISRNALSQLLPLLKVLEILDVIHEFQLLGRGEFAAALVANADACITKRSQEVAKPVRKAGRLDDISVKETEASATLSQTFADLASLQRDTADADGILEKARLVLRLVVKDVKYVTGADYFISTLLPLPTSLDLILPHDSALTLFLSQHDIEMYASINSYLISLRRAELHLSSLWKITTLRRCQILLGPRSNTSQAGQKFFSIQHDREAKRSAHLRRHWASASKALFVLNELGAYFQGEVIHGNWEHFRSWVDPEGTRRPGSAGSTDSGSRPGTACSARASQLKSSQMSTRKGSVIAPGDVHDPMALAEAHRLYLRNLSDSLLLCHKEFVDAFRTVLTTVDHFVALFTRLQSAWQGLDLQEDDGVFDALANFAKEEREVLDEMKRSGSSLEEQLATLVKKISGVEHDRLQGGMTELKDDVKGLGLDPGYIPGKARTIDRLIMKLDMLEGEKVNHDDQNMYNDE